MSDWICEDGAGVVARESLAHPACNDVVWMMCFAGDG